jgi:hypothetical protein
MSVPFEIPDWLIQIDPPSPDRSASGSDVLGAIDK